MLRRGFLKLLVASAAIPVVGFPAKRIIEHYKAKEIVNLAAWSNYMKVSGLMDKLRDDYRKESFLLGIMRSK